MQLCKNKLSQQTPRLQNGNSSLGIFKFLFDSILSKNFKISQFHPRLCFKKLELYIKGLGFLKLPFMFPQPSQALEDWPQNEADLPAANEESKAPLVSFRRSFLILTEIQKTWSQILTSKKLFELPNWLQIIYNTYQILLDIASTR